MMLFAYQHKEWYNLNQVWYCYGKTAVRYAIITATSPAAIWCSGDAQASHCSAPFLCVANRRHMGFWQMIPSVSAGNPLFASLLSWSTFEALPQTCLNSGFFIGHHQNLHICSYSWWLSSLSWIMWSYVKASVSARFLCRAHNTPITWY